MALSGLAVRSKGRPRVDAVLITRPTKRNLPNVQDATSPNSSTPPVLETQPLGPHHENLDNPSENDVFEIPRVPTPVSKRKRRIMDFVEIRRAKSIPIVIPTIESHGDNPESPSAPAASDPVSRTSCETVTDTENRVIWSHSVSLGVCRSRSPSPFDPSSVSASPPPDDLPSVPAPPTIPEDHRIRSPSPRGSPPALVPLLSVSSPVTSVRRTSSTLVESPIKRTPSPAISVYATSYVLDSAPLRRLSSMSPITISPSITMSLSSEPRSRESDEVPSSLDSAPELETQIRSQSPRIATTPEAISRKRKRTPYLELETATNLELLKQDRIVIIIPSSRDTSVGTEVPFLAAAPSPSYRDTSVGTEVPFPVPARSVSPPKVEQISSANKRKRRNMDGPNLTCHQCRSNIDATKMNCSNPDPPYLRTNRPCHIAFCDRCISKHYPHQPFIPGSKDWICFKCQGLCSCSHCVPRRRLFADSEDGDDDEPLAKRRKLQHDYSICDSADDIPDHRSHLKRAAKAPSRLCGYDCSNMEDGATDHGENNVLPAIVKKDGRWKIRTSAGGEIELESRKSRRVFVGVDPALLFNLRESPTPTNPISISATLSDDISPASNQPPPAMPTDAGRSNRYFIGKPPPTLPEELRTQLINIPDSSNDPIIPPQVPETTEILTTPHEEQDMMSSMDSPGLRYPELSPPPEELPPTPDKPPKKNPIRVILKLPSQPESRPKTPTPPPLSQPRTPPTTDSYPLRQRTPEFTYPPNWSPGSISEIILNALEGDPGGTMSPALEDTLQDPLITTCRCGASTFKSPMLESGLSSNYSLRSLIHTRSSVEPSIPSLSASPRMPALSRSIATTTASSSFLISGDKDTPFILSAGLDSTSQPDDSIVDFGCGIDYNSMGSYTFTNPVPLDEEAYRPMFGLGLGDLTSTAPGADELKGMNGSDDLLQNTLAEVEAGMALRSLICETQDSPLSPERFVSSTGLFCL